MVCKRSFLSLFFGTRSDLGWRRVSIAESLPGLAASLISNPSINRRANLSSAKGDSEMRELLVKVTATAAGIALLSLSAPAWAGGGSAVGAGLVGLGVGAVIGSALAPQTVYVAPPPPPPVYYAPPPAVYVAPPPEVYVGPAHYREYRYRYR